MEKESDGGKAAQDKDKGAGKVHVKAFSDMNRTVVDTVNFHPSEHVQYLPSDYQSVRGIYVSQISAANLLLICRHVLLCKLPH